METILDAAGRTIGSASKLVFILVAFTACAGFFMGILEPKDFMALAMMAFAFYFGTPSGQQGQPIAGAGYTEK
jgi:hypothetical protein